MDGVSSPERVDTGKGQKSAIVKSKFVRRVRHPRSPRYSNPAMLTRAYARRRTQRKAAKLAAAPRAGVATFDNRPVAAWLKPYLVWAREHGWRGTLNSGWRDPAYSESLCRAMCGAPSCPGKCAGRASNHAGSTPGAGAVDVTDYARFGELMRQCPHSPRMSDTEVEFFYPYTTTLVEIRLNREPMPPGGVSKLLKFVDREQVR